MSQISRRQIRPGDVDSSLIEDDSLTSADIKNYTIKNEDIALDADIELSKLSVSGAATNSIIGFDGESWGPVSGVSLASSAEAGTQVPQMDGTGSAGVASHWSREDHIHPSDTSRAPLSSPAFTGTPTAPTASANTNTTQIATTAFAVSQDAIIPTLTADPTGFPNRTATTLSFNSETRTFTISPTSSTYDVWLFGTKYTKTAENVVISNTSGLHYISYGAGGVLSESMVFFDLATCAQVATILWDAVGGVGMLYDERHGLSMDWSTHKHLHLTQGTGIISGFSLSGYTPNTDTDAAVTWTTTAGVLVDEDIYHNIAEQGVAGTTGISAQEVLVDEMESVEVPDPEGRDLSIVISAQAMVIKDLIRRIEEMEGKKTS